jgi:hypothetical protein
MNDLDILVFCSFLDFVCSSLTCGGNEMSDLLVDPGLY